jgi:hypothetical protein
MNTGEYLLTVFIVLIVGLVLYAILGPGVPPNGPNNAKLIWIAQQMIWTAMLVLLLWLGQGGSFRSLTHFDTDRTTLNR